MIAVVAAACLAAGCGGGDGTSQIAAEGSRSVTLTAAQSDVVLASLKEMTGDASAAEAGRAIALTLSGQEGVHVCGHVQQGEKTYPYYLELRQVDGKPVAERGQVGSDSARQSKVAFMCRRHGN